MFRGRLRRRTYWGRMSGLYAALVAAYAGLDQWVRYQADQEVFATLIMVLVLISVILLLIIQTVKRLHDTNLTGWWWWLLLVPILGNLFGVGIPLVDGTAGSNRFGPDPKNRRAYDPLTGNDKRAIL